MPFPVPEAEIAKTEAAMGVTFPAMFKARMSRDNGGDVELDGDSWELFPFYDTTNRKTIARSCNDIKRETEQALAWNGFPADGIAIARDGSGDLLFLRRDGGLVGREVWMFLRETRELRRVVEDVADLWEQ